MAAAVPRAFTPSVEALGTTTVCFDTVQAVAEKCGWLVRQVADSRGGVLMVLRKVGPAAYERMEALVQEARVRFGGTETQAGEYRASRRPADGAIICDRADGAKFLIKVEQP